MNPKIIPPSISQTIPAQKAISKDFLFKPNERFNGQVIKSLGDHEWLVSAKGREFKAYSSVELEENTGYLFRVQSTESKLILQVVGDPNKLAPLFQRWDPGKISHGLINSVFAELMKTADNGNHSGPVKKILARLKHLLSGLVYKENEGDAAFMKRLVRDGGLSWERKLAKAFTTGKGPWIQNQAKEDLKALFLSLRQALQSDQAPVGERESLSLKVEQALQFIEQNQLLNLMALKAGIGPFFFIPGLADDLVRAEVFLKEKKKKDHGTFYLVLFLEFCPMGPMEAHIHFKDNKIHLQIFSAGQEQADFLKSNQALLTEGLRKIGIDLAAFDCGVKDKTELGLEPFFNEEKLRPAFHLVI
ncbi:MAG: hypothetical protein EHM45_10845 [Desulfobacteraceae bacterium]|nr:MAG: hypothetical protein EHM45_10845 [Desulfobacteraceae bacterium]